MAENIVIKNPLGSSITYGEYDNILVSSSDGTKLNYSKLPEVTIEDNGKVLGVVDGTWSKMSSDSIDILQADWDETDDTSPAYIKNKPNIPEEYIHPETHQASMIDGLASVATSGDYNDLNNTPIIPSVDNLATIAYVDEQIAAIGEISEQVQADWNETDVSSPAYIKNKPIISDVESSLPEVTTNDNNKVLKVVDGVWVATMETQELPSVTVDDAGKFLRVNSVGVWTSETILNAEEVGF